MKPFPEKNYFKRKRNSHEKRSLIVSINRSIDIFNQTYLEKDFELFLKNKFDIEELKYLIINKIYFNANKIFNEIDIDLRIQNEVNSSQLILFFKKNIKNVITNFSKNIKRI